MIYFCTLPALFNIGWAAVQIATMSVVVSLTYSQGRRDKLVGLRNGFTYISNLTTLLIAIVFILLIDDQILTFRLLAYTLTFIGMLTSLLFIFGVPEATLSKEAVTYDKAYRKANGMKEDKEETRPSRMTISENISSWTQWLTNGAFYIHALVYMFARMAVNVTMTLTPFYLIHVLKYEVEDNKPVPPAIATVPLASYTTSMIFSLFGYGRLVKAFGNRLIPLLIGVIIT
jgi:Na+/melibiose symporter-like transporter